MYLTIAFLTNRKDPCIKWFFDSLHNETGGDYTDIKIIVLDYWAQVVDDWTAANVAARKDHFAKLARHEFEHVPPKPTVWQGPYRLAKINYFAAANMRNTALCMAPDGYIAYVDDLSVILPGWLKQVREIMAQGFIAMGAYSKVINLQVNDGKVVNYQWHPAGRDSRLDHVKGDQPFKAPCGWSYGCSLAIPVESLLTVNGFDEDCDSMGFEDVICGIMLERAGNTLMYCPKMRTLESEERHFLEVPFSRIIKNLVPESTYKDSSHAILDWVQNGRRVSAPNYQSMRETRAAILAGSGFPISQIPEHDWRDAQPIREMDQTR